MIALVIDDNTLIRKMIRAVLEEEGLECHEASSVASALESLRRLRPDVCFLDQNLPDGDGLEILRTLQAWTGGPRPRIYLLTGNSEESITSAALEVGASGVLFKPVNPDQIIQKVRER